MQNMMTWCEIPVTDISRAKNFYSEILGFSFTDERMDGFEMAMIDADPASVSRALVCGEGYKPSKDAAVIYLAAGDNLSGPLEHAVKLGGKVVWPKTPIKDGEAGYFAQFIDCEGNRVGLYSIN